MIKIAALNEESDEESDSEEEVTREALEQIALQQYGKALDLQRKGNLKDAMQLLKDLLDTELLYEIKKPAPGEKATEPLFNLKYLCHKNVAAMQSSVGEVDAAIESYCAAADLDNTDVTLWHRLGLMCLRAERYDMALNSFQRGADRNPRHWPCLDKIVTLLLGLGYYEDCISAIHDTLQLDPGYLRGLVYRKHIYTLHPYIRDYMEYLDKKYKWNDSENDPLDEVKAAELLKEADIIYEVNQRLQKAEDFKCVLPDLKLRKPITSFTWLSIGESIVNMHKYMTENCFSHACFIEMIFEKENKEEPMEICEEAKKIESSESKSDENYTDTEKNCENGSENENNDLSDKEKTATDTEKMESDIEIVPSDPPTTEVTETGLQVSEGKEQRKAPVRRRGSDLSFLQQWEWCNKRRSGRKKPVIKDNNDNIYDMLRKMVPACLVPDIVEKKENREGSLDITDLDKLFEEKDPEVAKIEPDKIENNEYFGSELEQKDVENFVNKYTENKRDIIEILNEFLCFLCGKWKFKWPENLSKVFIEANKCFSNHIDIPTCTEGNRLELIHYVNVNILVEEFIVNDKLNASPEDKQSHNLSVAENIGLALTTKPQFFGTECLELMLRYLWVKLHSHLINRNDEFALDCLYQLTHEFQAMGDHHDTFKVKLVNFVFKPIINEKEISEYIKFLERNKKLSTVMELYEAGNYEEVLFIVKDSFEHCKDMAWKQEEEMSLDFAVQLSIILDAYWALRKVDECFKWSLTCLHEALKHFFHYTSGCQDYEKWALAVVKILHCMEHILSSEGLSCLVGITPKDLSQGLEDIIRIIGHQVETKAAEMPFGTVIPWIIMHYILQREEDQGRGRTLYDKDLAACDDVPNPLMVLFIGHEQLGNRGWCSKNDAKLLYFILDTVVPRLRSPSLSKSLEQVLQYMEQCVYCLFGHPGKKNKIKYLEDHNVTAKSLDWNRAQQVYEIFRPLSLPELQGKVTALTADTEHLFHRILSLLPVECDLQKYIPDLEKYMTGKENKMPMVPPLLPYKMRDIYFLLGDYYFKKEEGKMAIKYNMFDVIINNGRFESWAQITLAKGINLERMLNSCNNINNEKDFMRPAKTIIRCFKRTLDLESNCDLWEEYGVFSYAVHSFCSRLLKQASESLSMEDFESLEKQKDEMLETAQKCFGTVSKELPHHPDPDKIHEGMWMSFYFLGKVAEKRNQQPSIYTDYYLKSMKSLHEAEAIYPSKINYNSPQNYSIEVLEIHYRIHASILKYIEQHENKPIPASVGKVFMATIEGWKNGPFSKKAKKPAHPEGTTVSTENETMPVDNVIQAANILKRSVSDAGEEDTPEAKKLKLDSAAAKIRRSASYDTERLAAIKETPSSNEQQTSDIKNPAEKDSQLIEGNIPEKAVEKIEEVKKSSKPEPDSNRPVEQIFTKVNIKILEAPEIDPEKKEDSSSSSSTSSSSSSSSDSSSDSTSDSSRDSSTSSKSSIDSRMLTDEEVMNIISACLDALEDCVNRFPLHYKALYRIAHYHFYYKKGKDIERCRDIMLTSFTSKTGAKLSGLFGERKTTNFFNNIWRIPLSEIDRPGGFANHMNRCVLLSMEILKEIDDHKTLLEISLQLQRIPEQDKKYLRDSDRDELAQQAFSLCVQSLKGQLLKFSQQADLKSNEVEKKAFNSLMLDIYRAYQKCQKQPNSKQLTNLLVDGFKLVTTAPINENVNWVDLSMRYCQSLIQALKQQATLASLDKSQNTQKKQTSKAATVDVTKGSTATTSNLLQTKPDGKSSATSATSSGLPKMSPQEMAAAFQNYIPMLNDPIMSQQAAAALSLSYLSNISAIAGYTALQNSLQSSLQSSMTNSFQAEFYRQFLSQSLSPFNLPPPKKQQKRAQNKPSASKSVTHGSTTVTTLGSQTKGASKSYTSSMGIGSSSKTAASGYGSSSKSMSLGSASFSKPMTSVYNTLSKAASTTVITSVQKSSSATLAPSMGTVLPTLPASLTASLTSSYVQSGISSTSISNSKHGQSSHNSLPNAHMSSSSTVNTAIHTKLPMPHQQVSPGKTLQEKLAERQKHSHIPSVKSNITPSSHEISSLSRLPSSLTITKSSMSKPPVIQGKKPEAKKSLPFGGSERPKPTLASDEVIVLDDDD